MTRRAAFDRLDGVRDELVAARFALRRAIVGVRRDPQLLRDAERELSPSHLRACAERLELTYTLRLFAEFESVARSYWAAARARPTRRRPQTEVLLNRVAAVRLIPPAVVNDAHGVRRHRNDLVHDEPGGGGSSLTFDQCKSRLGFFLSYFPRQW